MNVLTCTARHDGAYLVTFKRKSGAPTQAAVSSTPMEPGDSFTVQERKGYAVAIPNRKPAQ